MPLLGEMAALAQIYEEHRSRLLEMVRRRIDPGLAVRLDAEDVLGEVYLEARRRWPRFRDQVDLPAYVWLYGIAKDCLLEAWRWNQRECRSLAREMPWPEQSSLQLGYGLVQAHAGPLTQATAAELSERIRDALKALRDDDREILWMRHYDDLSFRDISMTLGATENTVTVRYVRALRRLKEHWNSQYERES